MYRAKDITTQFKVFTDEMTKLQQKYHKSTTRFLFFFMKKQQQFLVFFRLQQIKNREGMQGKGLGFC